MRKQSDDSYSQGKVHRFVRSRTEFGDVPQFFVKIEYADLPIVIRVSTPSVFDSDSDHFSRATLQWV